MGAEYIGAHLMRLKDTYLRFFPQDKPVGPGSDMRHAIEENAQKQNKELKPIKAKIKKYESRGCVDENFESYR